MEHFVFAFKVLIDVAIPESPSWVLRKKKRELLIKYKIFDMDLNKN